MYLKSNQRGVTLIEVLSGVVITSILMMYVINFTVNYYRVLNGELKTVEYSNNVSIFTNVMSNDLKFSVEYELRPRGANETELYFKSNSGGEYFIVFKEDDGVYKKDSEVSDVYLLFRGESIDKSLPMIYENNGSIVLNMEVEDMNVRMNYSVSPYILKDEE